MLTLTAGHYPVTVRTLLMIIATTSRAYDTVERRAVQRVVERQAPSFVLHWQGTRSQLRLVICDRVWTLV